MDIDKRRKGMTRYATVKITPESAYDDSLLSYVLDILGAGKRIADAQIKMHEATTISADLKKELFKIKKSWAYRILNFISLR